MGKGAEQFKDAALKRSNARVIAHGRASSIRHHAKKRQEGVRVVNMSHSMTLLPPPPDCCQECATKHAPEMPHNKQSLFYMVRFEMLNNRAATWEDAMAHCTEEMKKHWRNELTKAGEKLK